MYMHLSNSFQWKIPGRMNPSRVQHVEPTRAIMFEKSGICITITAVINTKQVLMILWNKRQVSQNNKPQN